MVSRRVARALLLALALGAACAGIAVAKPFVYVSNSASGQIAQFDAPVGLTPLSPATVIATGAGPLALSPAGTSLYAGRVAGGVNSSIYQYAIGSDGSLTPRAPATVAVGGENTNGDLAVSPEGATLYYAVSSGAVYQFTIAGDGTLAPKAPASVAVPAASSIAVSPDGKSAYVARDGGTLLYQFTVGSGGTLTPKSPATVTVDSAFAPHLAVAPGGDVYMVGGGKIQQFSAATDGTLTAKSPPSVPVGAGANGIVVSAAGTRVYVSVPSIPAGSLAFFDRGAGGQLTPSATPSLATSKLPIALALTSDGGRLFVPESANYSDQQAIVQELSVSGTPSANGTTNVFAASAGAPSDVVVTADASAVPTGTPTSTPTPTTTAVATATATPYPVAPKLGPLPKKGKVKGGRAAIKVSCLAGGATCAGKLKLTVRVSQHAKSAGKASFTIAAGKVKTVKVKLSKAARKARKKARKHRLKVKAVATAGTSTVKRTITLR